MHKLDVSALHEYCKQYTSLDIRPTEPESA